MAGIYVTTSLDAESRAKLRQFMDTLPLEKGTRMKAEEYHITLAYSKAGFEYKHSKELEGVSVKPLRWDIFGNDEKVLVLVMESEELQKRFQELCSQGYVCSFPDYKPHITVATAPESANISTFPLPEFNVTIKYEYSEPLTDGFVYKPAEMCENLVDPLNFSFIHFLSRATS